ncbi:MAG: hypothetical protein AAB470_02260 [Patescibacteria group bacterium]|mgnify:CR=1 FL=1
MDPDNFGPKNNPTSNISNDAQEQEPSSERVFEFSENGISPVTEDDSVPTNLPVSDNSQNPQAVGLAGQTVLKPSKPAPIPIKEIKPIVDNTRKRSLQDEITSVLPKNLRNQEVAQSTPSTTTSASQISQPPLSSQNLKNTSLEQDRDSEIKPIRTYESDVADVMSHKKTSRASIAIAESNKKDGGETISNIETSRAGKKILLTLLSLIFVGGGVIGAYYLYTISPLAPAKFITPQQKIIPSIIPRDSQVIITLGDNLPVSIQSKIQTEIDKTQALETIKEIIFANKDSTGSLARISGPGMIEMMDIGAPDTVLRSLTADWMLGVHNNIDNKKTIFVVVTTNFFQNTFSGMLQWESVMADDIKQYLYPIALKGIANISSENVSTDTKKVDPLADLNSILPGAPAPLTTTSTTTSSNVSKQVKKIATSTNVTQTSSTTTDLTPPLQPYFTLRGKFEDRIVKNKDVREFRTDTGTTLFLYSFIDNSHLIITGNEATLSEILTRLEKQSLIR